ncbi:MAG TPA: enoyl-CoA hydratase/isomerase family protein, partial [Afifellaceae bacterium]|nr:enoyl-CoA hydratase/isomerase family protein [Afifellaceae bacterium]
ISVVHFKSALRTFCAGADLNLMRALLVTPEGRNAMVAVVRRIQDAFSRLEAMPMVSVAEIGGAALGGGLELALACDLRVAGESARLGLPEAGLGLVPGAGGTQRLPRICGEAVARRLILGAEVVDGSEAGRLGLVQWVMPDDQLADWTQSLVARLAALPGPALAACKSCIAATVDGSPEGYDRELQVTRELHGQAETQRRIRAFLERAS